MAQDNILKYSTSPHIKAPTTTKKIMINVCIALLPAYIAGIVFFSWKALVWVLASSLSAVLAEWIYLLICGKKFKTIIKEFDFSSLVTGMLVGLTIGTNYPIYAPILGSIFAIIVVKMIFGGTGKNIVNPAIVGRIFIFISFQALATKWLLPSGEVVTGATTLTDLLEQSNMPNLSFWQMISGNGMAGCIGETCKISILIGAIYLAIRGIIKIQFPIIYILVTGLFTVCLKGFDFNYFVPSIFTGGLFLCAFFMATDYVTTPNTKLGNYIYFILLGLVTAGLRVATKMEAVSFAILLMNLIVPLIDRFVISRPFGFVKQKKEANK